MNTAYEQKTMSYLEIMDVVSVYPNKFENKSPMSFSQWCNNRDMRIMDSERCSKTSKSNDSSKQTYLRLYMLKQEFHDTVAKNIVEYLPSYHSHINKLIENGSPLPITSTQMQSLT
ncbi:hypothetical protein K492DRAFT_194330 [Lichtheimia hyalospora FSU 10163]|nr:hypothetical protein K492DRAFT_194330 [Lichtheimia hyalospora FSU 10163]